MSGRGRAALAPVVLAALAAAPVMAQEQAQLVELDGVRTILAHDPGSPVVAARLYLLGGARQIGPATAGIEPLLLLASARGAEGLPGLGPLEAEAATGSDIWVSAGPDWTVFGFDGLAATFEATWDVFARRLMHPTLDSASLEVPRRRLITSARARRDSPDETVRELAEGLAFQGHPYLVDPQGTPESLAGLTAADVRAYHAAHTVRSRLLLVVVGGVAPDRVASVVQGTLADLPAGDYRWEAPRAWSADGADLRVEARTLPTNYLLGYFSGPPTASDRYPAFEAAVGALSGFVSGALRAEGLTYASGASVLDRAAPGGAIYVSTTRPLEAMRIVNQVLAALQEGVFQRNALREGAGGAAAAFWAQTETAGGRAGLLGRTLLLTGRLLDAEAAVREALDVQPGEIRRAAIEYFKDIRWAYLGDPALVPQAELRRQ